MKGLYLEWIVADWRAMINFGTFIQGGLIWNVLLLPREQGII
jgi:hypothetical protein